MYVLIEKSTEKALMFKEKTAIGRYLEVNYRTLQRKMKNLPTDIDGYRVYKMEEIQSKSRKGNPNGFKVGFGVKDW
jgi:hypothetical protein